jgi:hypothetical protein
MPGTFQRVGLVEGAAFELRFGCGIESAREVHNRPQLRVVARPLRRGRRGEFLPWRGNTGISGSLAQWAESSGQETRLVGVNSGDERHGTTLLPSGVVPAVGLWRHLNSPHSAGADQDGQRSSRAAFGQGDVKRLDLSLGLRLVERCGTWRGCCELTWDSSTTVG